MTTQEVANRLIELCRNGQFKAAQEELYADDVVSIEPATARSEMQTVTGKEAVIAKGEHFQSTIEEHHGMSISDPAVAGRFFSCTMSMDITVTDAGRMQMDEVCVYEVKDGKVAHEQFFF